MAARLREVPWRRASWGSGTSLLTGLTAPTPPRHTWTSLQSQGEDGIIVPCILANISVRRALPQDVRPRHLSLLPSKGLIASAHICGEQPTYKPWDDLGQGPPSLLPMLVPVQESGQDPLDRREGA